MAIFPRGNGANGTFIDTTDALWCTRNSAVGLKGGFGNFYIGTWDSPLKKASGVTRITNETGWLGSQGLTLRQGPGSVNMSQRNTDSFNYDTPNLGGFSGSFQVTTKQASLDAADATPPNTDGRIYSLNGQYATGPLAVVAAYTQDKKNRAAGGTGATPSPDAEDTAWLVGVKYGIGPVLLGFSYTERESNPALNTKTSRSGYNLAGTWTIGGPHSITAGYAVADELKNKGSVVAAQSGSNTGAKQAQISYSYGFSKRTVGTLGYVNLKNDSNGVWNLTDLASGSGNVQPGESASAFVMSLIHTF
jgi:predicted porin